MNRPLAALVRPFIIASILILSGGIAAQAGQAQAARARVIVTVVDQSGAVVPDATVTLVGI